MRSAGRNEREGKAREGQDEKDDDDESESGSSQYSCRPSGTNASTTTSPRNDITEIEEQPPARSVRLDAERFAARLADCTQVSGRSAHADPD
jgi:hypothetical protein